jgi:hypothetical protein
MQAARQTPVTPNDAETLVAASQTAATRIASPSDAPSLSELEDVLYDLLASGDLNISSVTLERVQAFLHEHARQRKTLQQFVAFFEEQALSMRPERPNLLSLPLVEASSRSSAARVPPLFTPAPEPSASAPAAAPVAEPEPIYVVAPARNAWGWAAFAVVAASALFALGLASLFVLRSELAVLQTTVSRAEGELRDLRNANQELRDLLRSHAEASQRSELATRALLESFNAPQMQNSR